MMYFVGSVENRLLQDSVLKEDTCNGWQNLARLPNFGEAALLEWG